MGRKCFVPGCKSGYSSNKEKVTIFSTPRDKEVLDKWQKAIARRDRILSRKDGVCEKHFLSDDIVKVWSNGESTIPLSRYHLKKEAVPSIFTNNLNFKTVSAEKRRTTNTQELLVPKRARKKSTTVKPREEETNHIFTATVKSVTNTAVSDSPGIFTNCPSCTTDVLNKQQQINKQNDERTTTVNSIDEETQIKIVKLESILNSPNIYENSAFNQPTLPVVKESNIVDNFVTQTSTVKPGTGSSIFILPDIKCEAPEEEPDDQSSYIFNYLWNTTLILPNENWSQIKTESPTRTISFGTFSLNTSGIPSSERLILINEDLSVRYLYLGGFLPDGHHLTNKLTSVEELRYLLIAFQNVKICPGGTSLEDFPQTIFERTACQKYADNGIWRHINCIFFIEPQTTRCEFCRLLRKNLYIQKKRYDLKNNVIDTLKSLNLNKSKKIKLLRNKVGELKQQLCEYKQKISKNEECNVQQKLNEMQMPQIQQLLVMQCIENCKHKVGKSQRYDHNWLLISLFIQIKNPTGYNFFRENNILPLPCPRVIRHYLGNLNCVMDKEFLQNFEKTLKQTSNEKQKLDQLEQNIDDETLLPEELEDIGPELEDSGF